MKKAILALFLFADAAMACDCNEARRPIKKLFAFSEYVFTGKVIDLRTSKDSITHSSGTEHFQEVEFEVEELFKGKKTMAVKILNELSDCGQQFTVGKNYVVYVFINERFNKPFVNQCHSLCPDVEEDLGKKYLAEIRKFMKHYVPPGIKYPSSHLLCLDRYKYYIHLRAGSVSDPNDEVNFLLLPDSIMVYEQFFFNKHIYRKFDKEFASNTITSINYSKIDSVAVSDGFDGWGFSMEVKIGENKYDFVGVNYVQRDLKEIFEMFYTLIPQKRVREKLGGINYWK